MSISVALQTAVFEALSNDAAVQSLVGDQIHDGVPAKARFPRVTFGPTDTQHEDLVEIAARTETLQLDVWSRDKGRLRECKVICDAVRSALHLADLSLTEGALVLVQVESLRVFQDPDGKTAHGVVTVRAELEEAGG
ncbi:DUF3168 domain-containing protein [Shimia sp.]|uniref:DUF3168 domain-containing protein n=1 Tax=Shimia sp. TaxID=1954381 RepID=UPI003B8E2BC0